jgi:hypothetical protein
LFSERVFEKAKQWYKRKVRARKVHMSDKTDKHMIEELKETIQKKDPKQPVEKTLAIFCERTGISMETCRVYYKKLVSKGDIKEK